LKVIKAIIIIIIEGVLELYSLFAVVLASQLESTTQKVSTYDIRIGAPMRAVKTCVLVSPASSPFLCVCVHVCVCVCLCVCGFSLRECAGEGGRERGEGGGGREKRRERKMETMCEC